MKRILALILASILSFVGCARGQAWEDTHTLQLVLAGNGIDVVNTLTLILENNTSGGVTWTLPANNASGVLTNDGAGILSWGSPSGITLYHNDTVNTIQTILDIAGTDNITVRENAGHVTFTGALVQGGTGIDVATAYNPVLDRTVYTISDTATSGTAINTYNTSADLSDWFRLRQHGDTVSAELSANPAQGSIIMGRADGTSQWGSLLAGTAIALDKTVDGAITISNTRDTLQTNGVDNGRQSKLNLAAGTNISLSDNGTGTVTINNTATSVLLKTNGTNNGSQSTLNLVAGTDVTLTDNGTGSVTIDATGATNSVALAPTTTTRNVIKSPNRVKGLRIANAGSQTANLFEVGDSLSANWLAVGTGGGVSITVPLNISNTVDAHTNLIRNVANGIASADAVNLSQLNSAVSAASPMTTTGDIIYENATPAPARLPIGTTGQVLAVSGGVPTWASIANLGSVLFGDGSDGAVAFDGTNTFAFATKSGSTYTLTRDVLATSITISSGDTVKVGGFKIYTTGTLTVNSGGVLSAMGGNASGTTAGAGAPGNISTTAATTLGGGTSGSAGRTTTGSASNATTSGFCGVGGSGADGGNGSGTNNAGGAGSLNSPSQTYGSINTYPNVLGRIFTTSTTASDVCRTYGGGGGGAGGGLTITTGSPTSGAGGGGGGTMVLCCNTVVNNGVISANGGNGSDAALNGGTGNGGGGGCGGGGRVAAVYGSYSGNNPTANKGSQGAGVGTGGAGGTGFSANAGANGSVFMMHVQ